MKWSKLALAALTAFAGACSDSGTDDKKNNNPFGNEDMKEVTDTRSCQGTPAPNLNIYSYEWRKQFVSEHFHSTLSLRVNLNSTATMTNTCFYQNGFSQSASVTVPTNVNGNNFQILQGDSRTETASDGSKCSVGLQQTSVSFSFAGNCLGMSSGSNSTFWTP
jgi:hypothetical protein